MTNQDYQDLKKDAQGFLDKLVRDGDPFNGDDWSMVQILRRYLELEEQHISLKAGDELYERGYKMIGACDIGNYLALCETAGKIGEGVLCDTLTKMEAEKEYREKNQ